MCSFTDQASVVAGRVAFISRARVVKACLEGGLDAEDVYEEESFIGVRARFTLHAVPALWRELL